MAKDHSFDIVSEVNLQEIDNAVNQALHEVRTRYDLKSSGAQISFDRRAGSVEILAEDDFRRKAVVDVLHAKLIRRNISSKALK